MSIFLGESRGGVVVRALASHQSGPGSILGPGVICALSLLLGHVLAPNVFLRGLRFRSLHKNKHFQIPIRSGSSGRRATLWSSLKFPFILFITKYTSKCFKRRGKQVARYGFPSGPFGLVKKIQFFFSFF